MLSVTMIVTLIIFCVWKKDLRLADPQSGGPLGLDQGCGKRPAGTNVPTQPP
jgi:hypothetical protein